MTLLAFKFAMKDLGPLSYFLGIVMTRHVGGLFLSQSTYASDIIGNDDMASSKPFATSVDTKQKLSTSSNTRFQDPIIYRNLVGTFQYLTFTLLDILYVVQQVCLHMLASCTRTYSSIETHSMLCLAYPTTWFTPIFDLYLDTSYLY